MAFEFLVELDCPVKRAIPPERLVGLIKSRNQAGSMLGVARRSGAGGPASEDRIARRLQTPEGVEDRSANVRETIDEAAKLESFEGHCVGCPANAGRRPFGCYGSVSYPIRAWTEAWLMAMLPATRESTAGRLLFRSIGDLGYDGRPIAGMRPEGEFFEAEAPLKRGWGSPFSRFRVTSDQVLHMLFCLGPLQPTHCLMLALFLGLIPHEIGLDAFGQAAGDPEFRARLLRKGSRVPARTDDGQILAMIEFLRAILFAAALDRNLWTGY